ncbi:hypothetical protein K4K58_004618 [Colletotrichum sp. SAR11_239]|nr:hypothetical protein K4K58_004618 [Colletotrichum sp. SAR11_239]
MVMTKDYFIDNNKFDGILDDGEYDYVVVGSGCTALAFIQEALRINPHARILCLERGEDMRDFPKEMIDSTKKPEFWDRARDLLHVTGADKIGDSDRLREVKTAEYSEPAQLAVGRASVTSNLRFNKFSTPAPLLKIYEEQKSKNAASLDILLNCTVKTLAHYLAGKNSTSGQQYHVQITAIQSPHPKEDAEDAARECPDYAAAATYEQLEHSTEHVVFVCATLGEFSELNQENWFKMDPSNPDVTTNMKLQYTLTKSDRQLWNTMDEATYQTIKQMATPDGSESPSEGLEYWHINEAEPNKGSWKPAHPKQAEIRIPGIVHETSTAFMGSAPSDGSSVGPKYNVHGVPNVFVTGGALFPTAGSWNPTLTMCGFAQDLARQLEEERHSK